MRCGSLRRSSDLILLTAESARGATLQFPRHNEAPSLGGYSDRPRHRYPLPPDFSTLHFCGDFARNYAKNLHHRGCCSGDQRYTLMAFFAVEKASARRKIALPG